MVFLFCFLPIALLVYYSGNMKIKNIVLLISGLIFYAWGEPLYVFVMILSTVIDYTAGRIMDKYDHLKRIRFICLLTSLILNIGLLSVFKYSSFIINAVNTVFNTLLPDPKLPLPIGISFFTFQSMSYTIDLYMRKVKVQKSIISFTSFVTLFPQIVAGPIVRYSDIANEIDNRKITTSMISNGIGIFIKGLAKKLILANSVGAVWTTVKALDHTQIPALTAWVGIIAFAFQIYFDFSGYSDMAIGLGKMLGFKFPINFNHPYMANSISEFWRRWHITLGAWFKSYVYIPMGGNRVGTKKTIRNLIVVWFLTGLWHGASWNFVLWGLYFGVIIIIERFILHKYLLKMPRFFSWLYTFVIVVYGWVLFEFNTLNRIGMFTKALLGFNGSAFDKQSIYLLASNAVILIICAISCTSLLKTYIIPKAKAYKRTFLYLKVVAELLLFVICICYLATSAYNPFLYFNF